MCLQLLCDNGKKKIFGCAKYCFSKEFSIEHVWWLRETAKQTTTKQTNKTQPKQTQPNRISTPLNQTEKKNPHKHSYPFIPCLRC